MVAPIAVTLKIVPIQSGNWVLGSSSVIFFSSLSILWLLLRWHFEMLLWKGKLHMSVMSSIKEREGANSFAKIRKWN